MGNGFFNFINDLEFYKHDDKPVPRLNKRHRFLISPYKNDIKGAKVLDLGAYDGRWSYAFAAAGARKVVGIEARPELVDTFAAYPDSKFKSKVKLRVGDIFERISKDIAKGKVYDVIGVFGIYEHIMDHFGLIQSLRKLKPKLIIIDSEFMHRDNQMIQLIQERTDNLLNAAPQYDGQEIALKGIPSLKAMNAIADALDYDIEWQDWSNLKSRIGVQDYFRATDMRRGTCALRPR